MFYKLYRRRKVLYISAGVFVVIFYILFSGETKNNLKDDDKPRVARMDGETINMQNYKIPEPCHGCPGENGSPVYLTVTDKIN